MLIQQGVATSLHTCIPRLEVRSHFPDHSGTLTLTCLERAAYVRFWHRRVCVCVLNEGMAREGGGLKIPAK